MPEIKIKNFFWGPCCLLHCRMFNCWVRMFNDSHTWLYAHNAWLNIVLFPLPCGVEEPFIMHNQLASTLLYQLSVLWTRFSHCTLFTFFFPYSLSHMSVISTWFYFFYFFLYSFFLYNLGRSS